VCIETIIVENSIHITYTLWDQLFTTCPQQYL
jgi:hypothetical protein